MELKKATKIDVVQTYKTQNKSSNFMQVQQYLTFCINRGKISQGAQ